MINIAKGDKMKKIIIYISAFNEKIVYPTLEDAYLCDILNYFLY